MIWSSKGIDNFSSIVYFIFSNLLFFSTLIFIDFLSVDLKYTYTDYGFYMLWFWLNEDYYLTNCLRPLIGLYCNPYSLRL